MSRQGWQDFLNAEGVDDWVILHDGATAVFRVGSLAEAADLAQQIAHISGMAGAGAMLTIGNEQVTVRLNRGLFTLEPGHVELARAISAVARSEGLSADRGAVHGVQVAISAQREEIDVDFWRAVLGYDPLAEDNAIDPLGLGSTVWMQELDSAKALKHAMHVDVSVAREHAQARLEAAVAAGGRVVDDSEAPDMWILADRAGNKVCICAWPDGATPYGQDGESD
jgi:4a-hydroxytetrahydrobiopterin dehydratase